MSAVSALLVRFVHVSGMALLLGGSVFVWYACRTAGVGDDRLRLATGYEWVFWGTMAAMLVTGVGNLGTLGAPGPATRWGSVLTLKLGVVAVFVVGSFLRTFVVLTVERHGISVLRRLTLGQFYGATAWLLVLLVGLAEVLAHG
ncbi:hypothetical protein KU306_12385 [Haloferax larsenii]|uniref:Copper resistance protein D n=1 Tax=Haloferax larsenii TaxID=302484 RepID=A0ABY5RBK7_HALLR|nr:hypothetical protein [Haloferax larsenii]ELZ82297.1 hypothetical protein C455_03779 [Haloferax larsenii JCM 13917]UVE49702.1 hypothetical protein KU306_12385 [Haloferax larsenii]